MNREKKAKKQAHTADMAERTFKDFMLATEVFFRLYKLRKAIDTASIDSSSASDVPSLCREACWLYDLIKAAQLTDEYLKYEHDRDTQEDEKTELMIDMFNQVYYN